MEVLASSGVFMWKELITGDDNSNKDVPRVAKS